MQWHGGVSERGIFRELAGVPKNMSPGKGDHGQAVGHKRTGSGCDRSVFHSFVIQSFICSWF